MNKIKDKIPKLQYYQGEKSSGRKPSLSLKNCLFVTLLRLLVGLPE